MTLLELRRQLKEKKPHFLRQDAHKKSRLGDKWRKPQGTGSKMKVGLKSYRRTPNVGWGSPKAVYALHPSGLEQVYVSSAADLDSINPKVQGGLVKSSVGQKKRLEIAKAALGKGITLLNIKDPHKYIAEIEAKYAAVKETKDMIRKQRDAKRKDRLKAKEKEDKKAAKDELASKVDAEDHKIKEKKDRDKVLTSKNSM